jgi:hypothetical protein
LEALLDEQDGIQHLDAFDDAIFTSLERGEVVRVESELNVSSLFQATEMASSVGPLVELMGAFGEAVDADTQEAISGLSQVGEVFKAVPAVAHALGAPRFKFICPCKRDYLREDLGALPGECVVVGTLQRRLKSSERYSLLDAIGLSGLPREERRSMERGLKKSLPDAIVAAPAAIIEPLAIYR